MKILLLGKWVFSERLPRTDSRERRFARHLARRHELTLAFVTDDPNPYGAVAALRDEFGDLEFAVVPRGWKALASALRLATGESCTLSYFRSDALRTRLADRMRTDPFDLIWVSSSAMIQYALGVSGAVPLVMDFDEVDSEWWLRQAEERVLPGPGFYRTEARRLQRAEAAVARRAARCLVGTPLAEAAVRRFAPWAPVTIVPNGVDVDGLARPLRDAPPTILCCLGAQHPEQGSDLSRIASAVRKVVPEARFVLTNGGRALKRAPASGLEVAGPLADIRTLLARASVLLVPGHAGTGNGVFDAVLRAMAAALPVLTTSRIAEALPARPGRALWVEDQPDRVAPRLVDLLRDAALRREIGAAARAFVQTHYGWDAAAAPLDEIVGTVARGGRDTGARAQPGDPGRTADG